MSLFSTSNLRLATISFTKNSTIFSYLVQLFNILNRHLRVYPTPANISYL